jgi:hypothetical protein
MIAVPAYGRVAVTVNIAETSDHFWHNSVELARARRALCYRFQIPAQPNAAISDLLDELG